MKVRGGDIRQFTYAGREFEVKGGDANVNIDLGGFTNEAIPAGNGQVSFAQRRKIASITDLPILIDDARQDLEYLQGKQNEGSENPVTMTLASGETYSGSLAITGELKKATGDGTASLELMGSKLEQI